jgi:hypothetical protein
VIAEEKGVEPISLGMVSCSNDRRTSVAIAECGDGLQRKSDLSLERSYPWMWGASVQLWAPKSFNVLSAMFIRFLVHLPGTRRPGQW